MKKLNSYRVRDPVSPHYQVDLEPGQVLDLCLTYGPTFNQSTVVNHSSLLESQGVAIPIKKGRSFRFSPRRDMVAWWSGFSKVYLGEIEVKTPEFTSKLAIWQKCKNAFKENFLTVINPDGDTIRIQDHQIVEVVLFNPMFGKQLYWDIDDKSVVPSDPRFEPLAFAQIQPGNYKYQPGVGRPQDDAFCTVPRLLYHTKEPFYEFHFWLRMRRNFVAVQKQLEPGCVPPAKLKFVGVVGIEERISHELNVIFDGRPRHDDKTAARCAEVHYRDSDMRKGVTGINHEPRPEPFADIASKWPQQRQKEKLPIYVDKSTGYRQTAVSSIYAGQTYGSTATTQSYDKWCWKRNLTLIKAPTTLLDLKGVSLADIEAEFANQKKK